MFNQPIEIYDDPKICREDRLIKRVFFTSLVLAVFAGNLIGAFCPMDGDDKIWRSAGRSQRAPSRTVPRPARCNGSRTFSIRARQLSGRISRGAKGFRFKREPVFD